MLVPDADGLSTAAVYAELDRLAGREALDPGPLSALAARRREPSAPALDNDLEPAALSLRPELEERSTP